MIRRSGWRASARPITGHCDAPARANQGGVAGWGGPATVPRRVEAGTVPPAPRHAPSRAGAPPNAPPAAPFSSLRAATVAPWGAAEGARRGPRARGGSWKRMGASRPCTTDRNVGVTDVGGRGLLEGGTPAARG